MIINIIKSKSVLIKSKLPEVDYCINPYNGCFHGCVYCYARFMKRFTGHTEEWGEFVDVKINALEILNKEMVKNPKIGTILLGSVTDAYQPVEKKYKITRGILEILLKHNFPISILTKSDLVLRDIDLLRQFSDCEVGITVTTLNDDISRNFEIRASLPKFRIRALEIIHNAGIKTYAFIGPILPELTDLEIILSSLQGKVDFIMAECLNLKCGNSETVKKVLKEKYINLLPVYNEFTQKHWDKVEFNLKVLCDKFNLKLKGFYRH